MGHADGCLVAMQAAVAGTGTADVLEQRGCVRTAGWGLRSSKFQLNLSRL
jgi:hypothetical protein